MVLSDRYGMGSGWVGYLTLHMHLHSMIDITVLDARKCFALKHFGCVTGAQVLCFKAFRVPSDVFGCFRVWPSGALLTASEAFRVRSTVWDLKLLNGTRWGTRQGGGR